MQTTAPPEGGAVVQLRTAADAAMASELPSGVTGPGPRHAPYGHQVPTARPGLQHADMTQSWPNCDRPATGEIRPSKELPKAPLP